MSRMSLFSSLTNRIFFGSALLAVGSIAIAIYNVNVAVTRQAEQELRRGLDEAGTRHRRIPARARRPLHARGPAHRRSAPPEGRGRHQRPEDGAADRRGVPAAADRRPPARHRPAGTDARRDRLGQRRDAVRMRRLPGVKAAARGTRVERVLAAPGRHPAGRHRADLDRSAAARDPRHAQRRRQPRQRRGQPLPVADQQRHRVRDERHDSRVDAPARALAGPRPAPRQLRPAAERAGRRRGLHRQDAGALDGPVGDGRIGAGTVLDRGDWRERHHPALPNRAPGLPATRCTAGWASSRSSPCSRPRS